VHMHAGKGAGEERKKKFNHANTMHTQAPLIELSSFSDVAYASRGNHMCPPRGTSPPFPKSRVDVTSFCQLIQGPAIGLCSLGLKTATKISKV
jgi:hypothetical protein